MFTVKEVSAEDWPELVSGFADLTFEQSLTYCQAAAARIGATALYLGVETGGQMVAACCLRVKTIPGLGRGIAWAAGGPLTEPISAERHKLSEILSALKANVCAQRGHILRVRPPLSLTRQAATTPPSGFHGTDRSARYTTVLIDLSQPEEALMKGLHQKWRNALRGALKKGIEIDRGSFTDPVMQARFFRLYNTVKETKGFTPDIPPGFYAALDGADFGHDVLIAREGEIDLAVMTLARSGQTLTYLFGATIDLGRKLNAGYALMWQAAMMGQAEGLRLFDLGGIDEETNPDVTRYKRRTGGVEITAAGPFEALPPGPLPRVVLGAEALRARLKR